MHRNKNSNDFVFGRVSDLRLWAFCFFFCFFFFHLSFFSFSYLFTPVIDLYWACFRLKISAEKALRRAKFYIQYRSEISGVCTRKTHAPFLRKRVLKNACDIRVCAHFMRIFPFVIHSHNCALCDILLHNRRQNKRQFLQTPLKGYFRRQRNSRYVFPLPDFLIRPYYPITKRMINKLEFSYICFYNS